MLSPPRRHIREKRGVPAKQAGNTGGIRIIVSRLGIFRAIAVETRVAVRDMGRKMRFYQLGCDSVVIRDMLYIPPKR